jgi:hypothetical protein
MSELLEQKFGGGVEIGRASGPKICYASHQKNVMVRPMQPHLSKGTGSNREKIVIALRRDVLPA